MGSQTPPGLASHCPYREAPFAGSRSLSEGGPRKPLLGPRGRAEAPKAGRLPPAGVRPTRPEYCGGSGCGVFRNRRVTRRSEDCGRGNGAVCSAVTRAPLKSWLVGPRAWRGVCGRSAGHRGDEPRSALGPDSPTFGRSNSDPSTAEADVNSAWNSRYRFLSGIF